MKGLVLLMFLFNWIYVCSTCSCIYLSFVDFLADFVCLYISCNERSGFINAPV